MRTSDSSRAPEGRRSIARGANPWYKDVRFIPSPGGATGCSAKEPTMPQSFACLHHHLIFSTKNCAPLITPGVQPRLFDYVGGILRSEGCALTAAGGMPDHVHLLVSLDRQVAIAG